MTFDEWWLPFSEKFSLDDADSLRSDFFRCWEEAYKEGINYQYNKM